jgi:hypothetical protein
MMRIYSAWPNSTHNGHDHQPYSSRDLTMYNSYWVAATQPPRLHFSQAAQLSSFSFLLSPYAKLPHITKKYCTVISWGYCLTCITASASTWTRPLYPPAIPNLNPGSSSFRPYSTYPKQNPPSLIRRIMDAFIAQHNGAAVPRIGFQYPIKRSINHTQSHHAIHLILSPLHLFSSGNKRDVMWSLIRFGILRAAPQ